MGWVELRKPLNQYDIMKSVGGHKGNGNRLNQNVTSGKVIKSQNFVRGKQPQKSSTPAELTSMFRRKVT